ncbi:MAG: hypothetical protein A2138_18440 [Deltaproteobacteria bacterium RBG_16_71_12]|nr:MAG: hypothetical protein A2138_18440 [Deltaproteobacteria bacterium RBG_16_71_12]
MPGSSLLALLDDIATALDDMAVLTKLSAQKTAGVLGDDLALNAEQVSGVRAERELPIVLAVAKGSLVNKAILVPAALLISAIAPWAVTPLLMFGGLFLCYEGVEKLAHKLLHGAAEDEAHHREITKLLLDPNADLVAFERQKIKGAIRTDFILSAEIVVITLGTVAAAELITRVGVLIGVALLMTIGVYGSVALIVKLDDIGLGLARLDGARPSRRLARALGGQLVRAAPRLMKFLSVAGTVAMFLVGGGIIVHGLPPAHRLVELVTHPVADAPVVGPVLLVLANGLGSVVIGLVAGALALGAVTLVKRLRGGRPAG